MIALSPPHRKDASVATRDDDHLHPGPIQALGCPHGVRVLGVPALKSLP